MAVTIDDFKNQINADSDEEVDKYFDDAVDYVNLKLQIIDGQYANTRSNYLESVIDRAILEVATGFYLRRDGTPVSGTVNSSSLDTLMDYVRNPSI